MNLVATDPKGLIVCPFLLLTVMLPLILISDLRLFSYSYGYDWKRDEAEKNLLRTHTTAVSTRMLYALAQQVLYH